MEEKLNIPLADLQPGLTEKNGVQQLVEVKEEYTYGVTEERIRIQLDKYKHVCLLFTNQGIAIVNKIQDCYEVKNGTWHYIPRNTSDPEKEGFNHFIEFYCVDDKKELKRFTKTIKKYFKDRNVVWEPITPEYLEDQKQLNQ